MRTPWATSKRIPRVHGSKNAWRHTKKEDDTHERVENESNQINTYIYIHFRWQRPCLAIIASFVSRTIQRYKFTFLLSSKIFWSTPLYLPSIAVIHERYWYLMHGDDQRMAMVHFSFGNSEIRRKQTANPTSSLPLPPRVTVLFTSNNIFIRAEIHKSEAKKWNVVFRARFSALAVFIIKPSKFSNFVYITANEERR